MKRKELLSYITKKESEFHDINVKGHISALWYKAFNSNRITKTLKTEVLSKIEILESLKELGIIE